MAANGGPICKHGIYWHHCGKCQNEREGMSVDEPKESVEDILLEIFKALVKAEQDDPKGFKKAFSPENMKRYQEFIKERTPSPNS